MLVFAISGTNTNNFIANNPLNILFIRTGSQYGEYFGAAVTTADLNSDGFSDLIVGAPLASINQQLEAGCAYVFLSLGVSKGGFLSSPSISSFSTRLMGDLGLLGWA